MDQGQSLGDTAGGSVPGGQVGFTLTIDTDDDDAAAKKNRSSRVVLPVVGRCSLG